MSSEQLAITDEPKWIGEDVLFAIHSQQIERFGGAHGIRDPNVVRSALARPINKRTYEEESCDLADLAAMYLVGLVGTQGFVDGNKRTGLACALVFLTINAMAVDHFDGESLYKTTLAVANSEMDATGVAKYFRSQLSAGQNAKGSLR